MSNEFKRYTRTEPVFQMRKLSLEEVLGEVDVTRGPRVANAGDMLAKDSKDQWLIPKDVVEKYYKLVEDKDVEAKPVFIGRMGLETPVERFKDTLNHFTRVMSDYNVVFCYNDTDETVFEIVK
jgi:hypothetical protein